MLVAGSVRLLYSQTIMLVADSVSDCRGCGQFCHIVVRSDYQSIMLILSDYHACS